MYDFTYNFLTAEMTVELEREEFLRQVDKMRLENEAMRAYPSRPSLFKRAALALGDRMVALGENIRRRQERSASVPPCYTSLDLAR